MADRTGRKSSSAPAVLPPSESRSGSDESERALGHRVSIGLPLVGLAGAAIVGAVAGLGSALLVIAAATLLGTIGLLWASIRTLSGDAPLALGLEAQGARRHGATALGEEKRRVLRALKDLESEHAVGKIDPADYQTLVARYREEAKSVMRQMDLQIAPLRDEAQRIARAFLTKRGLDPSGAMAEDAEAEEAGEPPDAAPAAVGRVACASCAASNEADATFCKQCGASMTAIAKGSHAPG